MYGIKNRSKSQVNAKYSAQYKAIYQDYNWCFDRYINKGMSHKEMAQECGAR